MPSRIAGSGVACLSAAVRSKRAERLPVDERRDEVQGRAAFDDFDALRRAVTLSPPSALVNRGARARGDERRDVPDEDGASRGIRRIPPEPQGAQVSA